MINVGIIGSTGYAGQQVFWFLNRHKNTKVQFITSYNYTDYPFLKIYPQYYNYIQDICINMHSAEEQLPFIDVLFIALPHGKSFEITKKALSLGVKVIDLGADFRLKNPNVYKQWYGLEHQSSELLNQSVYGLPELFKEEIQHASLIANPGCYPTASILALAPLIKQNMIDLSSIIIDAKSGVSGAGRKANIATLFTECNESIKAYGVAGHRHTPEIEQMLSVLGGKDIFLSFTPHLIPMNRGILATCYGTMVKDLDEKELLTVYKEFYKNQYFVRVLDQVPETKWVKGSNLCDIGLKIDKRTNRIIVISAIDNLVKGAAGQAIQNMNLMFDFNETEGLDLLAMAP